MKVKDSTKQEKYHPKRREEAGDMTVQFGQVQAYCQLQGINGSSAGDNVLQRKNSSVSKLSLDDKGLAQESEVRMGEKAALFPDHEKFEAMTSLKQDETGMNSRSNAGSLQPFIEGKCSAAAGIKKGKVLKRSFAEMNSKNGPPEPKKEKGKEERVRAEP